MKSNIIRCMLAASIALSAAPMLEAQSVPASNLGALVYGSQELKLDSREAVSMEIPTYSRARLAVSTDSWITPRVENGKIILDIDENPTGSSRIGMVDILTAQNVTSEMYVTQPGWDLSASAIATTRVFPVKGKDACKKAAGRAEPNGYSGIDKSFDNDASTMYHSAYGGFDPEDPTQWPVLEYYFTADDAPASESVAIGSIVYVPRNSGGQNGRFGVIDVEIGTMADGQLTWSSITPDLLDLKMSASASAINIPADKQNGIRAIRFIVHTGDQNHGADWGRCMASVAEMQFYKPVTDNPDMDLFTDAVCSALKPGVTDAQIEAMNDPMLKELAKMMKSGAYVSTGMVSTHEPLPSPQALSVEWNTPGKLYDQTAGITGVCLSPGNYVVIADGISEQKGSVMLRLTHWYGHPRYKTGEKDANGEDIESPYGCWDEDFTLRNGVNVISVGDPVITRKRAPGDKYSLAYINNFDDEGLANNTASDITVHIVGGMNNGFIASTKSNAENQKVLDNAVYPIMDVVGTRTHTVWETQALKQYTKDRYVQYINILDQLVAWEHRVLGFEKYNRVPKNRTMAYVNYSYYMFQGPRGPSFENGTQGDTTNPDRLLAPHGNDDVIWGMSHEWGHQHQMTPYFMWTAMAEVTNNIYSAYNVAHMGYPINDPGYNGRYPKDKWQRWSDRNGEHPARIHKYFLYDSYDRTHSEPELDKDGNVTNTKTANSDGIVMALRSDATKSARAGKAFYWSPKLKEFALNQPADPKLRPRLAGYDEAEDNVGKEDLVGIEPAALNPIEAYSGNNAELILAPYINLMYYFSEKVQPGRLTEDYLPDLWPDLFEALRQTDQPQGSTIEKQGAVDKYELIASIFNSNKTTDPSINKAEQFYELYPESVWAKNEYISRTQTISWDKNSAPFVLNLIRKASRLTNYNLWSYFERYGVFSVGAIEQGDYGVQWYIMTQDMYDEFKQDMYNLEKTGEVRPLPEELRKTLFYMTSPTLEHMPVFPNDRPITPEDN